MNSSILRRLALSAAAIATVLAATTVPAATFAAGDCHPVPDFSFPRYPGQTLTARQIGGSVVDRELDATGCDIGVYNPDRVENANIHGARLLGVVVDGEKANVKDSKIHHIGDKPLSGVQHGEGIYYLNGARGTISGNVLRQIQKNSIVARDGGMVIIKNNRVRGLGPIEFIAQNGIVVRDGASAVIQGNTVTGFYYTPDTDEAYGMIFLKAGTIARSGNHFRHDEGLVWRVN